MQEGWSEFFVVIACSKYFEIHYFFKSEETASCLNDEQKFWAHLAKNYSAILNCACRSRGLQKMTVCMTMTISGSPVIWDEHTALFQSIYWFIAETLSTLHLRRYLINWACSVNTPVPRQFWGFSWPLIELTWLEGLILWEK